VKELRRQLEAQQVIISRQQGEIDALRGGGAPPQEELSRLVGTVFAAPNAEPAPAPAQPPPHIPPKPLASQPSARNVEVGFGSGGDPFLSANKACVRSDSSRCGYLDAADVLRLCARYQLLVPADKEELARKKGRVAYTKFIDALREAAAVGA